jgi:AcrR family transcriptional regulator
MPKKIDHEAMRERLLDGAGAVFAAHGYTATGMRELAAALRVSTGTLYHYFPEKKALFDQLVARTVEADLAQLEAALGAVPPAARLEAFFALVRQEEATLQLQSAVLVEHARLARADGPAALAPLRAAHLRYAAALARLLDVSPDRAELVLHAVSGLLVQRFTDVGATPFAPVERQLRALFAVPEPKESP